MCGAFVVSDNSNTSLNPYETRIITNAYTQILEEQSVNSSGALQSQSQQRHTVPDRRINVLVDPQFSIFSTL